MTRHFFPYIFVFFCSLTSASAQIVINEIVSVNNTSFRVADESPDWIELYNDGPSLVNLSGWRLNDDPSFGSGVLPAVSLAPGEFLLLFCDTSPVPGNADRTLPFKLSGTTGEVLHLFDSEGQLQDLVVVPPLQADIAFARVPDGGETWEKLPDGGTPGVSNVLGKTAFLYPAPGVYTASEINVEVEVPVEGSLVWIRTEHHDKQGEWIHSESEVTFAGATSQVAPFSHIPTNERILWDNWNWQVPEGPFSRAHSVTAYLQFGSERSPSSHYSYFLDAENQHTDSLPIIHLRVDSAGFFGYDRGIYVPGYIDTNLPYYYRGNYNQKGDDWVRVGYLEFYDEGRLGFADSVKLRLHGSGSRYMPMKSIRVTFSSEVGRPKLHYPLFPESTIDEFNAFLLRNSGQDLTQTLLRDGVLQRIVQRAGMDVDFQDYRPCLVFLNNEFWGLHNIREFLDERYIRDHFPEVDDVTLLEHDRDPVEHDGIRAVYGSDTDWQAFQVQLENMGELDDQEYAIVADSIDIRNVTDYMIVKMFFGVNDWPVRNCKLWRPEPGGKWRYMIFDQDDGLLDADHSSVEHMMQSEHDEWPNAAWSTLVFRRLLNYQPFRVQFYNRLSYLVENGLSRSSMHAVLAEAAAHIDTQIPRQIRRWQTPSSYEKWRVYIDRMHAFIDRRECVLGTLFTEYFGDSLVALSCDDNTSPAEFVVAPHPVEDELGISPLFIGQMSATVYSVQGQRVLEQEISSNYRGKVTLQLPSHMPPGMYIVEFRPLGQHQQQIIRIPFLKE